MKNQRLNEDAMMAQVNVHQALKQATEAHQALMFEGTDAGAREYARASFGTAAAEVLGLLQTMNDQVRTLGLPPTELRTFGKCDWMAFMGCDSAQPLIAENADYTMIVDGDYVSFMTFLGDEPGPAWGGTFRTPEIAVAAAEAIIANPSREKVTGLLVWENWTMPDHGNSF